MANSIVASCLHRIKRQTCSVNRQLLLLKMSYLLTYGSWISMFPYMTLLSKKIVSEEQLAITFTFIPISSILGPIFMGYLADKIGGYKITLIFAILIGVFSHTPTNWLPQDYASSIIIRNVSDQSENFTVSNFTVNNEEPAPPSHSITSYAFPILILIRILGYFGLDSANMMLDACGLVVSKEHGQDLGKQKMWANCAFVIAPLITGCLVDVISDYRGFRDYSIAFYISAGCGVMNSIVIYSMNFNVQKNERSLGKTAKTLVSMIELNIFFLAEIIVGIAWGWHISFFSVYVDTDLKASKSLLGASLSISGVGAMIAIFIARPIVERIGAPNTCCLALMVYSIRFVAYYFVQNPWLILLIESFDGFCGFLGIIAGNFYCASAAPPGMLASMNGLLYAAIFGVGRALGTSVGSSLIMGRSGTRFAYLVFGILSGSTSVFYFFLYHSLLKKIERKRLKAIKDSKEVGDGITNAAADIPTEMLQSKSPTAE